VIGVDTNVLLRYLLQDDRAQSQKAADLIQGNQKVLIPDAVLVETLWTLRGKKYGLDRDALVGVVQALFQEPNVRFEHGQAVWLALNSYRNSEKVKGRTADFADALIVAKARVMIEALGEPFEGVYTFDQAAQALAGMKAP